MKILMFNINNKYETKKYFCISLCVCVCVCVCWRLGVHIF